MNNRYGTLASWVYNLDKPVGRSFGDIEYYRGRLADCAGSILEPAVGNGRFFVPMLEAGFDISGFDPSNEMLGYCRRACAERSLDEGRISHGTFETFAYDRRFAAIVVPLGSFQLITDMAAAKAVLRRFFDHLAPGGRLMIDLDAIGGFLGEGGRVRSWATWDGDLMTLTDARVSTDYVAQTTVTHLRYELWKDTKLVDSELELFSLRWWGVEEFAMALRETGFVDVVASGDYRYGQAPATGCETISVEARRPE
ncbi:class I SAM-dependent methyltransferase [Aminobacter sp. MDW-2]|jgi:SAM-dependent methyltransferase|uniref:class I SAM-dependent methyltransferase n=1 Tax=Aminobacter sp. MDW-2 TaxID=2666139 RepID=UPI0012B0AD92|nr:class I SAM-dependent methyltransferase [Aminobacter sp. MDW-2]MRX36806.1 methyltransferase domain-containing protein [Aminobacter sp. MDW-2]QNH32712.1 class I SAM-dependent methyltransferase [Aminobacter sp. MDW-2]